MCDEYVNLAEVPPVNAGLGVIHIEDGMVTGLRRKGLLLPITFGAPGWALVHKPMRLVTPKTSTSRNLDKSCLHVPSVRTELSSWPPGAKASNGFWDS